MRQGLIRAPATIAKWLKSTYIQISLWLSFSALNMPVYADGDIPYTHWARELEIGDSADYNETASYILGLVFKIAEYIGGALIIIGLVQFATSLKNDDAEQKQRAVVQTIAGVILYTLYTVLKGPFNLSK